jgi:hypothetical protein
MKGGGFFGFLKSKNSTGMRAGEKLMAAQNSLERKTVSAAGLSGAINSAQTQDKATADAKKAYEDQKDACAACTTKLNELYKNYRNSTMKITDRLRAIGSVGFKALRGSRTNIAASKVNSAIKAVNSARSALDRRIQIASDRQKQLDDNSAKLKAITAQVAAAREATLNAHKDAATAAATAAATVATTVVQQANSTATPRAGRLNLNTGKVNNGSAKSNMAANMFGSTSFGGSRKKSRASRRRRY